MGSPKQNLMLRLSYLMFNLLKFYLHNSAMFFKRTVLISRLRTSVTLSPSSMLFLGVVERLNLKALLLTIIFLGVGAVGWTPPSYAGLPAGNAITDGKALLRYALPIENQAVRDLQGDLEDISNQMRANRRWSAVSKDVSKALRVLDKPDEIIKDVPQQRQAQAGTLIAQLKDGVSNLQEVVPTKDKEKILQQRSQLLNIVGELEELMVPHGLADILSCLLYICL